MDKKTYYYLDTLLESLLTNIEHEAVSTTEELEYTIKSILDSFLEVSNCEIKEIITLLETIKKHYE